MYGMTFRAPPCRSRSFSNTYCTDTCGSLYV